MAGTRVRATKSQSTRPNNQQQGDGAHGGEEEKDVQPRIGGSGKAHAPNIGKPGTATSNTIDLHCKEIIPNNLETTSRWPRRPTTREYLKRFLLAELLDYKYTHRH